MPRLNRCTKHEIVRYECRATSFRDDKETSTRSLAITIHGDLADCSPGDLIQALALLSKSGRLSLQREGEQAQVLFRGGRIIYSASSSVRESLGSLLLSKGLIDERQLHEALELQGSSPEEKRLGGVLIEMGLLSQEILEETIREQFSRLLSEFIVWRSGEFRFDSMEIADHGEVEVEAEDLLVPLGVETTHVLLEAARQADESQAREVEVGAPTAGAEGEAGAETSLPVPEEGGESLSTLLDETPTTSLGGETVYRLLDVASEICARCVLFSVHSNEFCVVGHFGLDPQDSGAGKKLSAMKIPREMPGLLAQAADTSEPRLASLPRSDSDERILEGLGGSPQGKSVAVPLSAQDKVIMILYGDRLAAELSTGWLEQLHRRLQEEAATVGVT